MNTSIVIPVFTSHEYILDGEESFRARHSQAWSVGMRSRREEIFTAQTHTPATNTMMQQHEPSMGIPKVKLTYLIQ